MSQKKKPIHIRRLVQASFALACLAMGIQFYLFITRIRQGIPPGVSRPQGVEAFLPIASLMEFRQFVETGIFSPVHPAGVILLLLICASALFIKKGFCAWVCPLGLISDLLSTLHIRIFKKKYRLPKIPDRLLGLIKYGLLFFFIFTIFSMPTPALDQFIQSPYNQFADVKMLNFFTHISPRAAGIMGALALISFLIPHFWCRYLCPYGALLGLISLGSLGKIKRHPEHCIGCGKCEEKCPGNISIMSRETIHSDQCSACLSCVEVCPQKGAIGFYFPGVQGPRHPGSIALIVLLLFAGGIFTAKALGIWKSPVPLKAYQHHIRPEPTRSMPGRMPRDPEKLRRMMEQIRKIQALKSQKGGAQ